MSNHASNNRASVYTCIIGDNSDLIADAAIDPGEGWRDAFGAK